MNLATCRENLSRAKLSSGSRATGSPSRSLRRQGATTTPSASADATWRRIITSSQWHHSTATALPRSPYFVQLRRVLYGSGFAHQAQHIAGQVARGHSVLLLLLCAHSGSGSCASCCTSRPCWASCGPSSLLPWATRLPWLVRLACTTVLRALLTRAGWMVGAASALTACKDYAPVRASQGAVSSTDAGQCVLPAVMLLRERKDTHASYAVDLGAF